MNTEFIYAFLFMLGFFTGGIITAIIADIKLMVVECKNCGKKYFSSLGKLDKYFCSIECKVEFDNKS